MPFNHFNAVYLASLLTQKYTSTHKFHCISSFQSITITTLILILQLINSYSYSNIEPHSSTTAFLAPLLIDPAIPSNHSPSHPWYVYL